MPIRGCNDACVCGSGSSPLAWKLQGQDLWCILAALSRSLKKWVSTEELNSMNFSVLLQALSSAITDAKLPPSKPAQGSPPPMLPFKEPQGEQERPSMAGSAFPRRGGHFQGGQRGLQRQEAPLLLPFPLGLSLSIPHPSRAHTARKAHGPAPPPPSGVPSTGSTAVQSWPGWAVGWSVLACTSPLPLGLPKQV